MKCECEVTIAVREAVFQQSLHGTTFHRGRKDPWPVFRKIWTEITNRQRWKQNTGHHVRPCDLGFTAMIIWRRRSLHSCCLNPKRVLHLTAWPTVQPLTQPSYVPARLHCDGRGDCCIVDGLRANSLRKAMFHIVSVILSSSYLHTCYICSVSSISLSPPYTQQREGGQGQSTNGRGFRSRETHLICLELSSTQTADLALTWHFNASQPASWMHYCYYNSVSLTEPYGATVENCSLRRDAEGQKKKKKKVNVWRDDNAWKGINLKILLIIWLLQRCVIQARL